MDIEFESVERIRAYQEELLRKQIAYLATHSPYYQRVFAGYGIDPSSIRTIDDLQRVPFTEKADLQRFNDDFLCVPREDIIDYITTSGTLGDPVLFGCTEADLQRLAYNEHKSFACAGAFVLLMGSDQNSGRGFSTSSARSAIALNSSMFISR